MASAALSAVNNSTAASRCSPASRYKTRSWRNDKRLLSRCWRKLFRCEARNGDGGRRSAAAPSSWAGEYDLYALLGVERTSETAEIRKAYRTLQKRCHPDIAGPAGHDMAILLNHVYSLLSDPASRAVYDLERSKLSAFQGYTGKPIYSRWLGHESEQRAVFVEEVKCIGCLKCALHATKTFAIESAYGRARVVAQWADSEDKIFGAIKICPVDCISIVKRSDLAALEFLMSKQPRGSVRMTGCNNVGVRVANVFDELNKFQRKFDEMNAKSSPQNFQDSNFQRKSRTSAMEAIMSVLNSMYSQKFSSGETHLSPTVADTRRRYLPSSTEKLREAASKMKAKATVRPWPTTTSLELNEEDYWVPLLKPPPPSSSSNISSNSNIAMAQIRTTKENKKVVHTETNKYNKVNPMIFRIPLTMAAVSVAVTEAKGRDLSFGHGLQEHIAGTWALEIINSFELQVVLAGITWFFIGLTFVAVLQFLGEWGISKK